MTRAARRPPRLGSWATIFCGYGETLQKRFIFTAEKRLVFTAFRCVFHLLKHRRFSGQRLCEHSFALPATETLVRCGPPTSWTIIRTMLSIGLSSWTNIRTPDNMKIGL